ncbi:thermonuclease family protein [Candidatus Uhrbacteria bacterium]|nr:thermonuclease family protein [Candidatus Uhrbacteria bacterium]
MRKIYFQYCVVFLCGAIVGSVLITRLPNRAAPAPAPKPSIEKITLPIQASAKRIPQKDNVSTSHQDIKKSTVAAAIESTKPFTQASQYFHVTKVIDGDTFDVLINGTTERIRPIGIDSPETVDTRKTVECFGKEASKKTTELLLYKNVRLEKDPAQEDRDIYGRLLRYVYRDDGLFFNQWMIENGYAHEYTYKTPYAFQKKFKDAQTSAREQEKGLWTPNACAPSGDLP